MLQIWQNNQRTRIRLILSAFIISAGAIIILSARASAVSNQQIVELTNAERATGGLTALSWQGGLANSAWVKARDMCDRGYWSHTAPDGTEAWSLMKQSGYSFVTAGENLARGFTADSAVVAGWMASPGHRANIMKPEYRDIGIGYASCEFEGSPTTFVVAHYGATTSKPAQTNRVQTAKPQPAGRPAAVANRVSGSAKPAQPVADVAIPIAPTPVIEKPAPTKSFGLVIWEHSFGRKAPSVLPA